MEISNWPRTTRRWFCQHCGIARRGLALTSPGANLIESIPAPSFLMVSLLGLKEDSVIEGLSTGISGDSARDSSLHKYQYRAKIYQKGISGIRRQLRIFVEVHESPLDARFLARDSHFCYFLLCF